MVDLNSIIASVSLPVALPEDAFFLFGRRRRVPDFDLIVEQLPITIQQALDANATASANGKDGYLLPLLDGDFLRLKIEGFAIIEISIVHH